MKIIFLGTGTSQGIPVIGCTHEVCISKDTKDKRLRSSIAIIHDENTYIIDCGPDFRQQMLNQKITKISGLLFTHFHADHTAGLDDIRPFTQRYGSLPIFAKKDVIDSLKERFDYIFSTVNRYVGAPSLTINEIEKKPFQLNSLEVDPIEVNHGNLNIFGYRFNKMAYITDAKMISEEEKRKLLNLDVLIVNALRIDRHPTHFNLEEALQLVSEVQPKKTYLIHISHKLGFHEEVSKILPKNVFLAYDGLSFDI